MFELLVQIAILAAILGLFAVEVARIVRFSRRERQWQATVQTLQKDVTALCAGAVSLGKHLTVMEQRVRRLHERQDQIELRDPAQQSYGHAIRLAQRGADVDELISNCGLARGEAELLLRLHSVEKH